RTTSRLGICAEPGLWRSGSAERGEPRPLGGELLFRLRDARGVARLLGGRELLFGLRDRLLELAREAARAGRLLRIGAVPVLVLELADGRLHLAQAILDHAHLIARHLADLVPAALDVGEGLPRRDAIGGREQRLRLLEQGELAGEVLPELGALGGVELGLGAVQHVAGRLEAGPQGVIRLLAGATRSEEHTSELQ